MSQFSLKIIVESSVSGNNSKISVILNKRNSISIEDQAWVTIFEDMANFWSAESMKTKPLRQWEYETHYFGFSAQLWFTRHMRLSQYEKRCWFWHILFCWMISSFFAFGYSFSFPFWSSFYFCIIILVSLFRLFCISLEWQVGFLVGWRFSMFFLCSSSSSLQFSISKLILFVGHFFAWQHLREGSPIVTSTLSGQLWKAAFDLYIQFMFCKFWTAFYGS